MPQALLPSPVVSMHGTELNRREVGRRAAGHRSPWCPPDTEGPLRGRLPPCGSRCTAVTLWNLVSNATACISC